jgi:cytochrome c biogenesis protein CcmG/thiol:disulfide interchange protein DsbE
MSSLPFRALAFIALSLMISACGGALGAAQGPGEVGKAAPHLSIQSLNGKGEVSLGSLSGKVTVVAFWATWSEPSKKVLTQLEELRTRSGGSVEVIGISVDDTSSGAAAFAKAQGLSFPIAWDENHSLMFRWSVTEMPATFIVDGKGRVRFVHEPEKNKDQAELIAREVAQLTDESTPPDARVALALAVVDPTPAAAATPAPSAAPTPAPAVEESSAPPASDVSKSSKPSAAKTSAAKKPAAKKTKKKS